MPDLILASTSPWRLHLLRSAGLSVRAETPGVDESGWHDSDPTELATALASAKARAVHSRHPDAWVLGADQVVWTGEAIEGKPAHPEQHLARLLSMRGRSHQLITGFSILGPGGISRVGHEITTMHVRADITEAEVAAYVATGEGSRCAGGYAVEGHGAWLFARTEGDWNNILGLPLFRVLDALRTLGWRYGGPS